VKLPLSLIAIGTAVLLAGCSSHPPADTSTEPTEGPEPTLSAVPVVLPTVAKKFTVTSSAFGDGQPIPAKYTCQSDGLLPPVSWSGDLNGGKSVALVIDDPDAPDGGFVHWFVVDLPVKPPATLDPDKLPDGAHAAANTDGDPGWSPPCPDSGTHHYRFTVYALDGPSGVEEGTDAVEALKKLAPHVKAYAQMTGTVAAS
jgi:Raf kinase inhibitor-like YbhB/YbcL family protein